MESINKFIVKNRIAISRILVLSGLLIIFWLVFRGFFIEKFIDLNSKVNLDNAAKIGDFIGGIVGVIFTLVGIVLLYETLSLQRTELKESRQVFEKQQFENTFFGLIKMYNDIVNSVHFEDYIGQSFIGKDFFAFKMESLMDSFSHSDSIFKNRKIAIDTYIQFYTVNKKLLAHYFRTLYRIFKLIENSNFNDSEKMDYAKIVRAQLSEAELFFLNYNACTLEGQNFRPLIVKYNLIKHLPLLERLEFSEWNQKLTQSKVNSVNLVFQELTNYFNRESSSNEFYKTFLKGKFAIKASRQLTVITLKIFVNNNVQPSNFLQYGYGFDDFNNDELERLLKAYFVETFRNSNYGIIQENIRMKFRTDLQSKPTNKTEIWVEGTSINNETIKMK
jgi:hypothetical protein